MRREAELSQRRRYPGDWLYTFVEGDGKTFDYGVNYTECGICKFFKAQGVEGLIPYICLVDYPTSRALGTGLEREEAIGLGDKRCTFRYKRGR